MKYFAIQSAPAHRVGRVLSGLLRSCLSVAILVVACSQVMADTIVTWDLFGAAGNEVTFAPTQEAAGISGLPISRGAGVTPNLGANSFNSRGWDSLTSTDYVQLGFNVTGGTPWYVDDFIFSTRSSNTGPGTMDVMISIDGGSFVSLTQLNQPPSFFVNSILDINQLVTSNLTIRFFAANGTAANGGSISANGTFRIGNYFDGQDFTAMQLTGHPVPEPTSLAIFCVSGMVLAGRFALRRRRSPIA